MEKYYISDKIQIPIFFVIQGMLWLTILGIPIAIILRIIHDSIASRISNKYKGVPLIVVDNDDYFSIHYKNRYIKIYWREFKKSTYSITSITRFTFVGNGRGFAIETTNKDYGKVKIFTKEKKFVLKYVKHGTEVPELLKLKQNSTI